MGSRALRAGRSDPSTRVRLARPRGSGSRPAAGSRRRAFTVGLAHEWDNGHADGAGSTRRASGRDRPRRRQLRHMAEIIHNTTLLAAVDVPRFRGRAGADAPPGRDDDGGLWGSCRHEAPCIVAARQDQASWQVRIAGTTARSKVVRLERVKASLSCAGYNLFDADNCLGHRGSSQATSLCWMARAWRERGQQFGVRIDFSPARRLRGTQMEETVTGRLAGHIRELGHGVTIEQAARAARHRQRRGLAARCSFVGRASDPGGHLSWGTGA